jgi:hypothetical protein
MLGARIAEQIARVQVAYGYSATDTVFRRLGRDSIRWSGLDFFETLIHNPPPNSELPVGLSYCQTRLVSSIEFTTVICLVTPVMADADNPLNILTAFCLFIDTLPFFLVDSPHLGYSIAHLKRRVSKIVRRYGFEMNVIDHG